MFCYRLFPFRVTGEIAQSVEHWNHNPLVVGSSPSLATNCSHRLSVRTHGFHPWKRSSTLLGSATSANNADKFGTKPKTGKTEASLPFFFFCGIGAVTAATRPEKRGAPTGDARANIACEYCGCNGGRARCPHRAARVMRRANIAGCQAAHRGGEPPRTCIAAARVGSPDGRLSRPFMRTVVNSLNRDAIHLLGRSARSAFRVKQPVMSPFYPHYGDFRPCLL